MDLRGHRSRTPGSARLVVVACVVVVVGCVVALVATVLSLLPVGESWRPWLPPPGVAICACLALAHGVLTPPSPARTRARLVLGIAVVGIWGAVFLDSALGGDSAWVMLPAVPGFVAMGAGLFLAYRLTPRTWGLWPARRGLATPGARSDESTCR